MHLGGIEVLEMFRDPFLLPVSYVTEAVYFINVKFHRASLLGYVSISGPYGGGWSHNKSFFFVPDDSKIETASCLGKDLLMLCKKSWFSDLTIWIDRKQFQVHRYFKRLAFFLKKEAYCVFRVGGTTFRNVCGLYLIKLYLESVE